MDNFLGNYLFNHQEKKSETQNQSVLRHEFIRTADRLIESLNIHQQDSADQKVSHFQRVQDQIDQAYIDQSKYLSIALGKYNYTGQVYRHELVNIQDELIKISDHIESHKKMQQLREKEEQLRKKKENAENNEKINQDNKSNQQNFEFYIAYDRMGRTQGVKRINGSVSEITAMEKRSRSTNKASKSIASAKTSMDFKRTSRSKLLNSIF